MTKDIVQEPRDLAGRRYRRADRRLSRRATRRFAEPGNLAAIFNDTSILIILALGQMVVILTRSIDLSMAANLAFTGMAVAMINAAYPGFPIPLLILVACLIGLALGALNGVLVWKIGIPSIVVTLGTLTVYRGATFVLSGGAWVNADQMSPDFIGLQRAQLLGIPVLSWFAIVAIAAFFVLMTRTPLGRSIYAIGVNPTAVGLCRHRCRPHQVHRLLHLRAGRRARRLSLDLALCHRLGRGRQRL